MLSWVEGFFSPHLPLFIFFSLRQVMVPPALQLEGIIQTIWEPKHHYIQLIFIFSLVHLKIFQHISGKALK